MLCMRHFFHSPVTSHLWKPLNLIVSFSKYYTIVLAIFRAFTSLYQGWSFKRFKSWQYRDLHKQFICACCQGLQENIKYFSICFNQTLKLYAQNVCCQSNLFDCSDFCGIKKLMVFILLSSSLQLMLFGHLPVNLIYSVFNSCDSVILSIENDFIPKFTTSMFFFFIFVLSKLFSTAFL